MVNVLKKHDIEPKYIVLNWKHYNILGKEMLKAAGTPISDPLPKEYLGCQFIIVSSDILEVVPEPKTMFMRLKEVEKAIDGRAPKQFKATM